MPSRICTIAEICSSVYSGGTPKSTEDSYYKNGTIPWLNTKEVNFNRINKTEKNITRLGFDNSAAKWVPKHAIVVAMYGATAGRSAITEIALTTNQACCNLVVNDHICDYRYLYYWLCFKYRELARLANGGAQQNLNAKIIKDFKIHLPELDKQNYISEILSSLDDKIEVNNKIIKKLEDLSNLYVHNALFSQSFPKNPTRLSTIAEINQESFTPKKHAGIVVEHYSIPAFDSGKYPTFELSDNIQSNKNKISDNCVLFSKLNPSTKRVWRPLCLTSYPITSTEFVALRPKEGYSKDLIFAIINSDEFNSFICTKTTGSTNSRQRVRPSDALLFEFFLPCPEQLAQLDKFIHPIYQLQSILIQQNIFLKNIRDSLLPKLFSGEIELKN